MTSSAKRLPRAFPQDSRADLRQVKPGFTGKNRRLLTVHHKDGNPRNNPADGSNWENLCIYCHDDEHSRQLLGDYLKQEIMERPSVALDLVVLRAAAADFRYLLSRGYPRSAALALVGNRYELYRPARQILHRGVFAPSEAAARRARLRLLRDVAGRPLGLDGHNVLITLECALQKSPPGGRGRRLPPGRGPGSRGFRLSPATDRVLALLADYLRPGPAGPFAVFYDAPLSLSGELARRTAADLVAARGLELRPGRAGAGAGVGGISRGHRHQRHRLDRRPRHGGGPGRGDHPPG